MKLVINMVLYVLFAQLLTIGGIDIVNHTGLYLALLGILMAVDLMSYIDGRKS